ncbi:GAF domain-containing protein [Desertifilum sp. FACHB-1129]|uniref:ATP-binding protein n=1 Tax=Desertifilum TaxID=1185872 RepID=UPI0009F3E13B|nr:MULTISPECIES: ATP-binding protein [Desertifilum]MBD2314821.1 GAF domain-containing protein [Desertifilum sp. FACHB-1129]MBD2321227.1 GAF domain-containing protein [Desertifilum sp. FACHB-866]MBD2331466.1 GAF domain-containing protein [Desertifilum sp. FACHB-868]MDA0208622.1 GAF domain-containing protein [Cyanobacteria bacterium FC1]
MFSRQPRNFSPENPESTTYESSPIHQLGCIQPHGVLLVLQEPELQIMQVSENTQSLLGLSAEQLLGTLLLDWFETPQIESFQLSLNRENVQSLNPLKFILSRSHTPLVFDGIIHRYNHVLILELEPTFERDKINFLDFYHLIKHSTLLIQQSTHLQELYQVAVQEVRKLTGFDRVVLYQFREENHGIVVAEDKLPEADAWLGLHYPATDIPEQSRRMFFLNWIRAIPNTDYHPVRLVPEDRAVFDRPLDLSLAVLRSASPCHLEYLHNLGVKSSLTISLLKDNQLWGLIACHHQTPKYLPYVIRAACEFLGQSISLELTSKVETDDFEYKLSLKNIQAKLLEFMSQETHFFKGLLDYQPNLLDLVNAQGAALCLGDEIQCIGNTPSVPDIQKLVKWLATQPFENNCYQIPCLAKAYPEAVKYKQVASGILATPISRSQRKYIVWFRPEVIQTVNWAGNPYESFKIEENGKLVLCPRNSFALWKEQVECQSIPWKSCEIEAAIALRQATISIVIHKADELTHLNAALQESESREREKAQQLEHTLQQLQRTQTQLIQSEKMSSLGQLVAGVAHEINNPVNFVYGNLLYASSYTQSLIHLLELYAKHYPNPAREIQQEVEEIDLDFVIEDLPKLLSSMHLGAERIREIVQSLRNFSRLDESEMKSVDIHEGLESTLLILGNRLKFRADRPGIQIIKHYGDLPLVECYAGQLNQVFMNILANAIDVLEDYNRDRTLEEHRANPSIITISTEILDGNSSLGVPSVLIKIADNGPGIPEDVQPLLFDPFFTTKPIGKGTGIGLAISHQIVVEKHKGKLSCDSSTDRGAEFKIEIPIQAGVKP